MKRTSLLILLLIAVPLLGGCATHTRVAPPVSVTVSADDPIDAAEVARLRTIVDESIRRWVHGKRAVTVSISLLSTPLPLWGGTSMGQEQHAVPLAGGNPVDTGGRAVVNSGGGGGGGGYVQQVIVGRYVIADSQGNVIESRVLRLPATESFTRLELMHDTADFIAGRLQALKL
jgi:hypothetical protein